eukprot:489906-Amphidinium_carterae.1
MAACDGMDARMLALNDLRSHYIPHNRVTIGARALILCLIVIATTGIAAQTKCVTFVPILC